MRIVFCALVRDCLRRLRRHRRTFNAWQAAFPDAQWVFVENDSRDATRSWLEAWACRDSRVKVIGKNTGERTIPATIHNGVIPGYSRYRIDRMAGLRNQYLDWVQNHLGWSQVDALVVIDPDVRCLPIKRTIHWLRNLRKNEAITAFGEHWIDWRQRRFHDSYAFIPFGSNETQTPESISLQRLRLSGEIRQWHSPRKVRSNFNALGIYPIVPGFEECRYGSLANDNAQVEVYCEHVAFHDRLAAKGVTLLLDPELRVAYNGRLSAGTAGFRHRLKKLLVPSKAVPQRDSADTSSSKSPL